MNIYFTIGTCDQFLKPRLIGQIQALRHFAAISLGLKMSEADMNGSATTAEVRNTCDLAEIRDSSILIFDSFNAPGIRSLLAA